MPSRSLSLMKSRSSGYSGRARASRLGTRGAGPDAAADAGPLPPMTSTNFEFLRAKRPELATLGGFAERYVATDPSSALVKLRTLAEQVVETIYDERRLERPYRANLFDLLGTAEFQQVVPRVVISKLHTLRMRGNRAAHSNEADENLARELLRQAHDVAQWFHLFFGGEQSDLSEFRSPVPAGPSKGQLKREKRALLDQLARQEEQLKLTLEDLEKERSSRKKLERASEEERSQLAVEAERQAEALRFSEEATRKFLIDRQLIEVGWAVGDEGRDTDQVGQEVPVSGLPTPSGDGFVDYVLWGDDGRPLAVVEAKKTSRDPRLGQEQARQYADALEKEYEQRPLILYTNGVQIWLWDDASGTPPRKVYGFYSKDSLEYRMFQRTERLQLELVAPSPEIAGRPYQIEAVRRVTERFSDGHRRALLVQATGTGKTRVAISICDLMTRARWAKRILFLCDRRELRKQADNAFKEFLPSEPRTIVGRGTASDRDKRIYLATYPAMLKLFESFDVGFFDLVIADESHRSIYNKYRDLFHYFDAFQIGLTATPINLVDRNTYRLFGCEDKDPTSNFGLKEAINSVPPYLVPFRVVKVTTDFQRQGIGYSKLSDEQKRQLEEQVEEAEAIDFRAADLDKAIFNEDTSREVLRNLMEHGIRDASGTLPGKSIIFARSHRHAVHLAEVFDKMYPLLGGRFCRVIDNYDPRAEQLIEDFKDPDHELRLAISVDMLDTGIDVPEIVNLVFAKPVKSYVKFWQMIGRGTRLRPDLFGPGEHKREFLIFDHCGNFEYFDEHYEEVQAAPAKSLLRRVFEARVLLAETALKAHDQEAFRSVAKLIVGDLRTVLDTRALQVRDHWRDLQTLAVPETVEAFHPATAAKLMEVAAPLMRWVDIRGHEAAYRFDLLVHEAQAALLTASGTFEDLKGRILDEVESLRHNLNQVRAKSEVIREVRSTAFWESPDFSSLEHVRRQLRSVMKHKLRSTSPAFEPTFVDVSDSQVRREEHVPTFEGHELLAYRQRVEGVLSHHFAEHPAVLKIQRGQAVTSEELDDLARRIIGVDPQIDLKHLPIHINVQGDLRRALRSIIGLDVEAVDGVFTSFIHKHPELTAQQLRFIAMLKARVCANGGIQVAELYEAPFTALDAGGLDGVFGAQQPLIDDLLALVARLNQPTIQEFSA